MKFLRRFMLFLAMLTATPAFAIVEFIPPSDPVGYVEPRHHDNAGYLYRRGVVFMPTEDFRLTSVGLYQDVTNLLLTYGLDLVPSATGFVGDGVSLRNDWRTFYTSGFEYSDFVVDPITLEAGKIYYLWFAHADNANRNLFHDTGGEPFSLPGFTDIIGAHVDITGGYLPRIRLNAPVGVPEPGTWVLLLAGFAGAGVGLRRRCNVTKKSV